MLPQISALLVLEHDNANTKIYWHDHSVTFLAVYSIAAMAFGASRIVGESHMAQVIYFFVAGLAWIIPAGLLIRWMQRPDPTGV